ncbi:MAG: hypothetical protein EXS09_01160 [Gemmataceae bacterium]|nr:hypothetical protein [Gemmataceae bacterium]
MADLTPIPSAQQTSGPVYQPISGYVVGAGVATIAFVLFLTVIAYTAITSRRSALSEELLILPLLGAILATIGRSHVRNSEGTKTGAREAAICWWICIMGGAGFVAYLQASEFAIKRQSARFAEQDFFKELKEGRTQHAFLAMVPAEERRRATPVEPNAKDAESAKARDSFEAVNDAFGYQKYKHADYVRLFVRNGKAMEIEHLGAKDVGQEEAGFKATQLYKVRCPEGIFDIHVKMQALEGRKGGAPQWRIPGQSNVRIVGAELSQYGSLVIELEQECDAFAQMWMSHLMGNRPAIAQLLTVPENERQPLEATFTRLMAFGGGAVTPLAAGPDWLPPSRATKWRERLAAKKSATPFDDLQEIGFFNLSESGSSLSDDRIAKLRDLWQSPYLLHTSQRKTGGPGGPPTDASVLELSPNRILAKVPADLYDDGRVIYFRTHILVECTSPEVLAVVNAARDRGAATKYDGASLNLRTLPPRHWRISGLLTDMVPQKPAPPPQMDGPGGGPPH